MKGVEEKLRSKEYDHKKVFKQIARKLHPDKLSEDDPRLQEFENDFKTAAAGINDGNWGDLFNIAEKHDIDIEDYDSVNQSIKDSIVLVRKKSKSLKTNIPTCFMSAKRTNTVKTT